MDTQKTDQQRFDEQVDRRGKLVLQTLAGVAIVAALMMSIAALAMNGNRTNSTVANMPMAAAPATAVPNTASISINHVMHGCHTLVVNGAMPGAPSATVHLAAGGMLRLRNNDVMPHQLVQVGGPQAALVTAAMNHMGAQSTVTFPAAGTYSLTTKAGEDYASGITTTGADNTLRIKVVVAA